MIYLLTTPKAWGPISAEQVEELTAKLAIFDCGHCSNAEAQVFHNVWGRHCHKSAAELLAMMPSDELERERVDSAVQPAWVCVESKTERPSPRRPRYGGFGG